MKKVILYMMLAILLISFASATQSLKPSDYILYDDFDTGIDKNTWTTSNFNWANTYGTGSNWSAGGMKATAGVIASAQSNFTNLDDVTICIRMYDEGNTTASRNSRIKYQDEPLNFLLGFGLYSPISTTNYISSNGLANKVSPVVRTIEWHDFCLDISTTRGSNRFYIDKVLANESSAIVNPLDTILLDTSSGAAPSFGYRWDLFRIWTGNLSAEPQASNIIFISPTPIDGAVNNTNVTLNATCAGNVYMWFGNLTEPQHLVITNASSPANWTTNVSVSNTYYYRASCWNATRGMSINSTLRTWTYDLISPSISINANNEFSNSNYSQINQFDDIFRFNLTFEDNNSLFGYLINITRNNVVYYNETNISLSGTSYVYNKDIDISTWETGVYNISVLVADSHTDEYIKPYGVFKTNKLLEFDTDEGNYITIESNDNAATDYKKYEDRYEFSFDFADNKKATRTFHLTADKPIIHLPNSTYKGHFVVWNSGKGNWIDFEGVEQIPIITKLSDYHYLVTFDNLDEAITFKSIGGLNSIQKNYTWYRGNYTLANPDTFILTNTFLQLNITTNKSIKDINATLFYNGIKYNGTSKTNLTTFFSFRNNFTALSIDGIYPFYWEVTTLQGNFNTTKFNISNTQLVTLFGIGNCTTFNTTTVIFNILNEDFPTSHLNATLEVDAIFWVGDRNNANNFTQSFPVNQTHILCLNNENLTIFADMYIKYQVPNSFTHRYYIVNTTFSNETKTYQLFNFQNQTGKSTLAVNIRNANTYENFEKVYTYLERRYIGDGIWRVVQMGFSDDFGNAFFDVKEENEDYRVILKDYQGHILHESITMNFNCLTGVCSVIFKILPFDSGQDLSKLQIFPNYNNETQMLSIYFEDLTFLTSSVTAKVTKQTGIGSTRLCYETKNSHSGTILCNLTGQSGDVLLEVFATASPEDDKFSQWISLGRKVLAATLGTVESTFLAAGIYLILALSGVFLGATVGIIMAVVAVAALLWLQLLNVITITLLIIIASMAIAIGINLRR